MAIIAEDILIKLQQYWQLIIMLGFSSQHIRNTNLLSPVYRYHKQQIREATNEQNLLQSLSQIANQILSSLQNDKDQFQKKASAKQKEFIRNAQQHQSIIIQLKALNESLVKENSDLNLKLDQSLRYLKRSEMKIQLFNNKIRLLSHELTEKEAVIKYLENKSQENNHYHSKKMINSSMTNLNASLEESFNGFNAKDLPFAKVKETKLKFQDYANNSVQMQQKQNNYMAGPKNKSKRIRTESSYQVKQNKNQDNLKYSSKAGLNDFLSSKLWTSSHDKTLAKKMRHNNSSFMMQNSGERHQSMNENRTMGFDHSAYFFKPDHTSLLLDLPTGKHMFH